MLPILIHSLPIFASTRFKIVWMSLNLLAIIALVIVWIGVTTLITGVQGGALVANLKCVVLTLTKFISTVGCILIVRVLILAFQV